MIEAIYKRRSVRHFLQKPIPQEDLDQILEAGMWAPSEKNAQPWKFIVVKGESKKTALALMEKGIERSEKDEGVLAGAPELYTNARFTLQCMQQAPVLVFVVNPNGRPLTDNWTTAEKIHELSDVQAIGAAAENMALQATSLRIEAPIPGKNAVGIEVPNTKPASVCFREVFDGELWQQNAFGKFQVPLLLGKDAAGDDLVVDLAKLPHLLVAGATGQGKSVCLNSIINGLLMCRTPEQLKLIMVDPKRVEFTAYNRLPHLLVPIINDTNKVVFALRAALIEMDRRLKLFSRVGCRNIVDFNTRKTVTQPDMFGAGDEVVGGDPDTPRTIPYIVIVIDEVAETMHIANLTLMTTSKSAPLR